MFLALMLSVLGAIVKLTNILIRVLIEWTTDFLNFYDQMNTIFQPASIVNDWLLERDIAKNAKITILTNFNPHHIDDNATTSLTAEVLHLPHTFQSTFH